MKKILWKPKHPDKTHMMDFLIIINEKYGIDANTNKGKETLLPGSSKVTNDGAGVSKSGSNMSAQNSGPFTLQKV